MNFLHGLQLVTGDGGIRVRSQRRSLTNSYHIQGREKGVKFPKGSSRTGNYFPHGVGCYLFILNQFNFLLSLIHFCFFAPLTSTFHHPILPYPASLFPLLPSSSFYYFASSYIRHPLSPSFSLFPIFPSLSLYLFPRFPFSSLNLPYFSLPSGPLFLILPSLFPFSLFFFFLSSLSLPSLSFSWFSSSPSPI